MIILKVGILGVIFVNELWVVGKVILRRRIGVVESWVTGLDREYFTGVG
jgi:hypothetical protein